MISRKTRKFLYPALMRFCAIGVPMIPRPKNPIRPGISFAARKRRKIVQHQYNENGVTRTRTLHQRCHFKRATLNSSKEVHAHNQIVPKKKLKLCTETAVIEGAHCATMQKNVHSTTLDRAGRSKLPGDEEELEARAGEDEALTESRNGRDDGGIERTDGAALRKE